MARSGRPTGPPPPGLLQPNVLSLWLHTEAWPRSPRGPSDALRRNVGALRLLGIDVRFDPVRHRDGYHVAIRRSEVYVAPWE